MSTVIYSDIRRNMQQDPLTEDLALAVNDQAIKDSVISLVMTNKGERLYQPEIGGHVAALLFELMSEETTYMLKRAIQEVIVNWEPRAVLQSVDVVPLYDDGRYMITIRFYTIYNLEALISAKMDLQSQVP